MSIEAKLVELFTANPSRTPSEVEKVVGKKKYVSKYMLYLRLAGYDIVTHKDGRTVTKYVFSGSTTKAAAKPADRRAGKGAANVVKAPVPPKPPKAPKKVAAKKAEPISKVDKPVIQAKVKKVPVEKKDETEKTFGTSGNVSSQVDPEWDNVDLSDFKVNFR